MIWIPSVPLEKGMWRLGSSVACVPNISDIEV